MNNEMMSQEVCKNVNELACHHKDHLEVEEY